MVMNMAQTFLAIMVVYPFSDPGTVIQFLQPAINYQAALRWGTLASLPGVPSVTGKRQGQACSVLLPGKTLGPTQTSQCQVGSGTPQHKPASEGAGCRHHSGDAGCLWPELACQGRGDLRVPSGAPSRLSLQDEVLPSSDRRELLRGAPGGRDGQRGAVGWLAATGLSGAAGPCVCPPGLPGGV